MRPLLPLIKKPDRRLPKKRSREHSPITANTKSLKGKAFGAGKSNEGGAVPVAFSDSGGGETSENIKPR